jgi:Holliday junction resolvase
MSLKSKGINAERSLLHLFWKLGWACIRVAGSGSMRHPSPDLLAGNNTRKLAIECKATGQDIQYFDKKELKELVEFSRIFGAEPWVAIKFAGSEWVFLNPEDLKETKNAFSATKKVCDIKGLSINQLVS